MNKKEKEFFSEDFTGFFFKNIGGYIPPYKVEIFLTKLENELSKFCFSKSSETNLIRLISALFDKTSFINDSLKFPHHLEIISAIVSSSNFLTDIIVQNPEFLYQVFDNEYLLKELTRDQLEEEIRFDLVKFKSFNSKLNYLRQIKKRIILKIGICDILGFNELTKTTGQLTHLASSILSVLIDLCHSEISLKYNIRLPNNNYCLASLGKHGGNELNYSSDVDLILFYEKDFSPSEAINKEYFEILNETALLFIKSSSENTAKGYLYRVDFRLRPDGKHSPLCRTLTDYMRYYEARGENWERQMLIKLSYICGGKDLYETFYRYLRGFIFPSSHHHSMKEQVRKIKSDIERKTGNIENVKLFSGGIRDIEFSVQVLQLLNGGTIKELRNGNTLESIELLLKNNLLNEQEAEILKEAYIFYRKTEHFLQLMNDLQTHLIPEDSELLTKLANYLQLKDKKHFKSKLEGYREKVVKIFQQVVESPSRPKNGNIFEISFRDKQRANKNIKFLQSGSGLFTEKEFDADTMEKFKIIEMDIYKYLKKSSMPDKTLENFAKVIKASRISFLWYNQLQNKYFLKYFLILCEFSQRSIDLISSNSTSEDYFISGSCFTVPDESEINNISNHNLLLTLSVLLTLKKLKEKDFSVLISKYIDTNITRFSKDFPFGYFIAALGSYGSAEMNFASDIDFILVVDDKADVYEAEKKYEELVKALAKNIPLFEVDLRLRPEGKNSQLVRQMSSYEFYLNERARIWEFQALSKLRFVCGDSKLFTSFSKIIFNRLKSINKEQIRKEIIEMHKSMTKAGISLNDDSIDLKKYKGGFATIEFAVQYSLLSNPLFFQKCLGKPVLFTLRYLAARSNKNYEILAMNYKLFKKALLSSQNYNNSNNYKYSTVSEEIAGIDKQLKTAMRENLIIFEKILEK